MKSKAASPNSKKSPASKRASKRPAGLAPSAGAGPWFFLAAVSALALIVCWWRGWILYSGDAQAHLNIARRVLDSRTPGYEQLGTVWLPLPHVLMLPLAGFNGLWRSGLAGAFPAAAAFVMAGLFFFYTVRRVLASNAAAWTALAVFALNPNLLYLQSTPMTEACLLACLLGVLFFSTRYRETQAVADVIGAGAFALFGTLTRYDGWFILPFTALYLVLVSQRQRWARAALFCALAGLGPLYWLAHNWYYYGNPLEFYNGYYSAQMIYQRALNAGGFRYPGDHDWAKAWLYYRKAAELCAGTPLFWAGLVGLPLALVRKAVWPLVFLVLIPAFYVLSLYSSGTPIFVPGLWPNSYYNARYGLNALPLLAFGAAALAALLPAAGQRLAAFAVVLVAIAPWVAYPRPDNWVCWKEAQVNSVERRAWTREAAEYLAPRYKRGAGIFMSFGDQTGILQQAGLPLREAFHDGNGPRWEAATMRPELFLWEEWAIALRGDKIATALARVRRTGPRFELVRTYERKGNPAVEIYRRIR